MPLLKKITPPYYTQYPYTMKLWVGLITQGGTTAPTTLVIQDTLPDDIVFTRTAVGVYKITAASPIFTGARIWYTITNNFTTVLDGTITMEKISTTELVIKTAYTGAAHDSMMEETPIEIRIYP